MAHQEPALSQWTRTYGNGIIALIVQSEPQAFLITVTTEASTSGSAPIGTTTTLEDAMMFADDKAGHPHDPLAWTTTEVVVSQFAPHDQAYTVTGGGVPAAVFEGVGAWERAYAEAKRRTPPNRRIWSRHLDGTANQID